MEVALEFHTPDPERAVARAAWTCYHQDMEGFDELTGQQINDFLYRLAKSGHTSTFEHASFTFRIKGVSRALTHQLVRHRMASYSQQSQRYVAFDGDFDIEFIYPPSIMENDEAFKVYDFLLADIQKAYTKLVELGIPAEDARYILPNATPSEIVVTMNARGLYNFFHERLCNRAQWEIRALANEMWLLCHETAPALFSLSGPDCIYGKCQQGKMSCGKPLDPIAFD